MKFYFDTCEEKVYTSFNDLCEALREAHEEYHKEDGIPLDEWVKTLFNQDIDVYEVSDEVTTAYFNPDYGKVYTHFDHLENAVIYWDNFSDYVNERYDASEIFYMDDRRKEEIEQWYIDDSWRWFFDDISCLYMIDIKSKEVKECYEYDDLWDY